MNTAFDILHKNFDFRINNAISAQSRNLQIINAQLLSRLGFVNDEIRLVENRTREAIDIHSWVINNNSSECILEARAELDNALEYAGTSMMTLIEEVMYYVNRIEHNYFYPLIDVLSLESNVIQWSAKSSLRRYNAITQTNRLMQRLDDDYEVMVILYQASINNIANEMTSMEEHFNEVRASYFPQLNGIRDYFTFTANFITGTLEQCE